MYYKLCSELNIDPLSQTQYTECDTQDILSYFQISLKSFRFTIHNNLDPLLSLDLDNINFYLIHQKQPFYIDLEIKKIEINNLTNKKYPKMLYKDKKNLENSFSYSLLHSTDNTNSSNQTVIRIQSFIVAFDWMLFQLLYKIYFNQKVISTGKSVDLEVTTTQFIYPFNIINLHKSLSDSLQSEIETYFDIEWYGCSVLVPSLFDEEKFNLRLNIGNVMLLLQQHTYMFLIIIILQRKFS